MSAEMIFLPVIVQIFIVLLLYLYLAILRTIAFKKGMVDRKRLALFGDAWPKNVIQVNNNINNQFELPVLFYAIILIIWNLQLVNTFTHIAAWIFVILRIVHAAIHIGPNIVPIRRFVFTMNVLVVLALTIHVIVSFIWEGV